MGTKPYLSEAVRFIEPGKTTREEVLLRMGSPESTSAAADVFVYESQYRAGLDLVLLCGSGKDRTGVTGRLHQVKVEIVFDANARVRSVNVERGEAKK